MRPLRLDLDGFTVFREPTTIDFVDADFFALVGPTGAGKSTVLDAICFALYGTVPRWDNRAGVANALAPTATEARVRLIFSVGRERYAATRVVRRAGKQQRVQTTHAGLERLAPDFDPAALDSDGEAAAPELGEPLAGSPSEMESAVAAAVGLPYEQFTSCVMLPQGEFAELLHAKPAARQQILVNLLGLHVYERIREQASARASAADARLATVDNMLAELADATDDAVRGAETRVDDLHRLVKDTDAELPKLADAQQRAAAAAEGLAALDAEVATLSRLTPPADVTGVADEVAAAREAERTAAEHVTAAEAHEERLREQLDAAPDPARLHALLQAHDERAKLTAEIERAGVAEAEAEAEHATAAEQATTAVAAAAEAAAALDAARTADLAASLRPHLVRPLPSAPKASRCTVPAGPFSDRTGGASSKF